MLASFGRIMLALSAFSLLQAALPAAATPPSSRSPAPSPYTSAPIPLTRRNLNLDPKTAGFVRRRFQHRDADSAGPDEGPQSPQVLGWDDGLGVFTVDASISGKSYHMIPTFGTPNVIMSKSSGYSTGKSTGKKLKESFGPNDNSTYQVEIVTDTITLSGMQAPGVGIGKADSDVMIEKELTTHPVGILGLAPSNKDAYVERIEGATIASLVTASGPTPFNIQLGDKTGTLQFGTTFKPKVICPLTVHKGDSWDIVGQINGHPMDWGTLDLQEHNLYIPAADAEKMLKSMKLTPVVVTKEFGNVTTAKVDCAKGAALTLTGPKGGAEGVKVEGPASVWKAEGGECYSLLQGYEGEPSYWAIPAQFFKSGTVFDIRGKQVGFGVSTS